jgi:hypothetical protein
MKYNIGVIYPSRGLLYTETLKEVLYELQTTPDVVYEIYWSHGNKLPFCFNKPLSRALKQPHTHIWMIEDDMVFKKGILKELLDADEEIISCDYPLLDCPSGTILYDENDEAFFTGTGCMLVKKPVLDAMPKPIFTSKISWEFKSTGEHVKFTANKVNPHKVYGMHDISFGLYHYMRGNPIKVSKTVLSQRKLVKKGDNATNQGWDKIKIYDQYMKILPVYFPEQKTNEKGLLRTVKIDGVDVMVQRDAVQSIINKIPDPVVLSRGQVILDFENYPEAAKQFNFKEKI